MIIYGVALLSICTLLGVLIGDLLGAAIGVKANVGGVGFAMILLLFFSEHLKNTGRFVQQSSQGVAFWTAMYIPIVVAMAAQQNVLGAIKGGPMAIIAGALATVICFALIPVVDRIGRPKLQPSDQPPSGQHRSGETA
ncbi:MULTISPECIES: malonate transporter subunit MadL [unclassified Polaromonas]|uniref:malonate transporter subunit MadL n=1 Tax=unclassified Polaromonas TaxID=2638319 RepID=UPI0018CB8084|nr:MULTISPECIES: malonate transporter subunit MadL [unclassified Polaromonas]MBG6071642.1 malonate transporter MadL subunit [Polaromonas sp. CG_9.7]MBG6113643.1 malonate transporter MadL subunit [Polaromonas sp. CG_9.2]MDH6184459.1 malonate transporter MadL subunit [Polaromonas sp. CG_23.6]